MTQKEKRLILKQADRLLWREAWKAWKRLPRETKIWFDLEDVHGEAQLAALRCLRRYNPRRGQPLTLIYIAVPRALSSLVTRMKAEKRLIPEELKLVPIEQAAELLYTTGEWKDMLIDAVFQEEFRTYWTRRFSWER